MIHSSSAPALDYGSDYGRLSRPGGVEPKGKDKVMAAITEPLVPYRSFSPVASSANQSLGSTTQEHVGYGRFNTDRQLAIQATPASPGFPKTSQEDDGRFSLSDEPAPAAKKVKAANAEPLAPRNKQRIDFAVETTSARQSATQLLNGLAKGRSVQAGQKRRASAGDADSTPLAKRQHSTAPSCTRCVMHGHADCNGKPQCNHCQGKKCIYILCSKKCKETRCLKIHPSQYDHSKRKSGQPRRHVYLDNVVTNTWSNDDRTLLAQAVALLSKVRQDWGEPTGPAPIPPKPSFPQSWVLGAQPSAPQPYNEQGLGNPGEPRRHVFSDNVAMKSLTPGERFLLPQAMAMLAPQIAPPPAVPAHEAKKGHSDTEVKQERPKNVQIKQEDEAE